MERRKPYKKGAEERKWLCQYCSHCFIRKYDLQRHIETHKPAKEKQYYICAECDKKFTRKDYLASHRAIHLNPSLECATCHRCFTSKQSLIRHFRKEHNLAIDNLFKCKQCHFQSTYKKSLDRHLRTFHLPGEEQQQQEHRKIPTLKCVNCKKAYPSRKTLIEHYKQDHNIRIEYEYLTFQSAEEFERWRSPHYRISYTWQTPLYTVQNFNCHRSGFYSPRVGEMRKRQLKISGSKKLQGICPSEIILRQRRTDGLCLVSYQSVHVGHNISDIKELRHIYWSKAQKNEIIKQLSSGVPKDIILKKMYENYNLNDGENNNRLNLPTFDDISNITTEDGVDDPFTIENDPIYVDAFVAQNLDDILYYKKQNEKDTKYHIFGEDDFVLILQDEFQREALLKYGHKFVSFDGTHRMNPYNFVLHSMLVVDMENEGIPIAFLVTNRNDEAVVDIFLTCIRDRVGVINTKTIITDMDVMFSKSWCRIMNTPEFILYCTWQVRRVWRYNLNKLITLSCQNKKADAADNSTVNAAHRRQVIDNLKKKLYDLADELDKIVFLKKLTSFLSCTDPHIQPFIKYFQENYASNTQLWALCYRVHAGVNVNMHLKAYRRVLKYKIAKGKNIQTLSAGLYCIQEYMKYRISKNEMKNIRPMVSTKMRLIRKRHLDAQQHTEKQVYLTEYNADDRIWLVPSFSKVSDGVIEMYSIQENETKECSLYDDPCLLICELCQTCLHQFKCTCHDSSISNNMCKHIHALCLSRKIQELANETAPLQNVAKQSNPLTNYLSVEISMGSSDDENIDAEVALKNLHKRIFEQCMQLYENAKIHVQPETVDNWDKVVAQFIQPIVPTLEAMQRRKNSELTLADNLYQFKHVKH